MHSKIGTISAVMPQKPEAPMRILQLCSSSAVSGAERNVYNLATILRRRGHFVQAITPSVGWLPDALLEEEIPNQIMGMKGTGWWRTIGTSIKQIRNNNIDVVHTHLTRAAYIGHMIGNFTKVPIITSVHVANNDNIYRRLAHRQNRLVAVSDFVRGMLHGRGVPDRFIDTVYNGTDMLNFDHADPFLTKKKWGVEVDREIVGVIGRVCQEKGHLDILRAMKTVLREHPKTHLLFVGRVVPGFEGELENGIQENGLTGHVTLTGERQDVSNLIDSFTLSAMPSYMETFGIAALEAMARGKPVVATRVGGLPEVVREGRTGLLVDLEGEGLPEAISYLLANPATRNEMGVEAKRVVEEQFTLERMVSRFEDVYRRSIRA
jgi:glycosyltransferase involved in cell wall biosynthesis